jgi:hypothetical protein
MDPDFLKGKEPRDGDGSMALVSLLYFYLISDLYQTDNAGKGLMMVDGSVALVLLFYFYHVPFFTTQTLLEKGHMMMDGSEALVSLFFFHLISFLHHAHCNPPLKK